MISNGSQVLERISIAQFTGLLQSLGYRARIIRPDLVESASDGMDWCVELWPEGEAKTLVFKAELIVAHDPVADINKFLRFCLDVVPTYVKSEDDLSWQLTITAVRSLVGDRYFWNGAKFTNGFVRWRYNVESSRLACAYLDLDAVTIPFSNPDYPFLFPCSELEKRVKLTRID